MTALVVEQIINGLLVGSYYIVLALGLSMIFSLGGVVNLAHGAFYAVGAYFAYEIQRFAGFGGAVVLSPSAWESSARFCSASIARTRCWACCSPSGSR